MSVRAGHPSETSVTHSLRRCWALLFTNDELVAIYLLLNASSNRMITAYSLSDICWFLDKNLTRALIFTPTIEQKTLTICLKQSSCIVCVIINISHTPSLQWEHITKFLSSGTFIWFNFFLKFRFYLYLTVIYYMQNRISWICTMYSLHTQNVYTHLLQQAHRTKKKKKKLKHLFNIDVVDVYIYFSVSKIFALFSFIMNWICAIRNWL